MEWGMNPATIQLVIAASSLLLIVFGGVVAWLALRADHKVRNSQVLMGILKELNELFIPGDVYGRLKADLANGNNVDWSETMTDDHIALYRVMKVYDAVGRMVDGKMVDEKIVVGHIWEGFLQRYHDFQPIFDARMKSTENDGFRILLDRCKRYSASSAPGLGFDNAAYSGKSREHISSPAGE